MKFGKQLKVGLYPPWSAYYVPYGRLKRMITRIEHTRKPKKEGRSGYSSLAPSRDNSFNSLNTFTPPKSESLPLKAVLPGHLPPKVRVTYGGGWPCWW